MSLRLIRPPAPDSTSTEHSELYPVLSFTSYLLRLLISCAGTVDVIPIATLSADNETAIASQGTRQRAAHLTRSDRDQGNAPTIYVCY
jgi:hypothetical protein